MTPLMSAITGTLRCMLCVVSGDALKCCSVWDFVSSWSGLWVDIDKDLFRTLNPTTLNQQQRDFGPFRLSGVPTEDVQFIANPGSGSSLLPRCGKSNSVITLDSTE